MREIWEHSEVFGRLRDVEQLEGKCGLCEFKEDLPRLSARGRSTSHMANTWPRSRTAFMSRDACGSRGFWRKHCSNGEHEEIGSMSNITKLIVAKNNPRTAALTATVMGRRSPPRHAVRSLCGISPAPATCDASIVRLGQLCPEYTGELSNPEAKRVIDDLVAFKVPAVLFSGGEPLHPTGPFGVDGVRRHKWFARHVVHQWNADRRTNGPGGCTEIGLTYVGISLDGNRGNQRPVSREERRI